MHGVCNVMFKIPKDVNVIVCKTVKIVITPKSSNMSFYCKYMNTGKYTDRQGTITGIQDTRQARLTEPGSRDTGCCHNNIKTKLANTVV